MWFNTGYKGNAMFNKLISNLPFNPSLINQVSFYAKRLKQESVIRRTGFAFIALTMLLQIFAVISPAQATQSCDTSNNDIIHCGFKTKNEAVLHCLNKNEDFGTLLNYYNVNCDTLANATEQTIKSTDFGKKLVSVGRMPSSIANERSVTIPNTKSAHFFWRPLWGWDSAGPSSYKVLSVKTSDNQMLMVMFECGNLVTLNDFKVTRPQSDSQLKLAKLNQPTGNVKPGDTIDYTLIYSNKGGPAAYFSVHDTLPSQVSYVSSQYADWNFEHNSSNLKWYNNNPPLYAFGNTDVFGTPGFIKLKVKVNNDVPSGTTICNKAWVEDVSTQTQRARTWSEVQVCNTVVIECTAGQVLNTSGTKCETLPPTPAPTQVACSSLTKTKATGRTKRTFETKATPSDNKTIQYYTYDFGDNVKQQPIASSSTTNTVDYDFKDAGSYTVTVSILTSSSTTPITSNSCRTSVVIKPEEKPQSVAPIISVNKKAKNITQNIPDANNTTARAGDVIEYSLTTTNYGDGEAKKTALLSEELADVLEYATLDTSTLQGGIFDNDTKTITWNDRVSIMPGASITKTFRVKVKDPIPQTPRPDVQNIKSAGDLTMVNKYGDSIVTIKLPGSVLKTTETITTTTLPNTGPGTSLMIGFLVTMTAGYFFARSRLLAKELELVRVDFASTSGGA